jgi:hypothetical protein
METTFRSSYLPTLLKLLEVPCRLMINTSSPLESPVGVLATVSWLAPAAVEVVERKPMASAVERPAQEFTLRLTLPLLTVQVPSAPEPTSMEGACRTLPETS